MADPIAATAKATRQPAADFELVVGLEIHLQLATASKMFCACSADYAAAPPNSLTCPVCLGLPGALPVPNARAVALAMRMGQALGCQVQPYTWFERKNYHYPDLPKGYQISQYQRPLCRDGLLAIEDPEGGGTIQVRIERLHMEEDTAKLAHAAAGTLVDLNRAGVPLVEIVTRPDLRSPEAAAATVDALRQLVRWVGVSSGLMAAGALRVDVNCSLRPAGAEALGAKVEIKNLNTTAAVRAALRHERERQAERLASGRPIAQETRGWSEERNRTLAQRSKEEAHDYRYFPEPDLPPLVLQAAEIAASLAALPELPGPRRARLGRDFGLRAEEAALLSRDRPTADYFEAVAAAAGSAAGLAAAWITGPLFGLQNARGLESEAIFDRIPPAHLAELLRLVESRAVTNQVAKAILERMLDSGERAAAIVEREQLGQIGDAAALEATVREVIQGNPKAVADYRAGKETAFGFLMGGVMRATRGQADPELARRLLADALGRTDAG